LIIFPYPILIDLYFPRLLGPRASSFFPVFFLLGQICTFLPPGSLSNPRAIPSSFVWSLSRSHPYALDANGTVLLLVLHEHIRDVAIPPSLIRGLPLTNLIPRFPICRSPVSLFKISDYVFF